MQKRQTRLFIFQFLGPACFLVQVTVVEPAGDGQALRLVVPRLEVLDDAAGWNGADGFYGRWGPCRVHDTDIVAVQSNGQTGQKGRQGGAFFSRRAPEGRIVFQVAIMPFVEKPARTVLDITGQQVDFVIAEDGESIAFLEQELDMLDHPLAIGATVAQIAYEDQLAAMGMPAFVVVAQTVEQRQHGGEFAMDVSDDIEGIVGQTLKQMHCYIINPTWARCDIQVYNGLNLSSYAGRTMATRYDVKGTQGMYEPGSGGLVLANKLGITRSADIDEAELVLLQKLYESVLRDHLPQGRISISHLKTWHRRWLGNVYEWAGLPRSVNMSKNGFPFAPASQVPRLMAIFDREFLARYTPCTGFTDEQLIEAIAITHVEFILMHPFREGNGRISRLLADVMAVQAGHGPLDYSSWESNKSAYIAAIQQGLSCNYEPMKAWVAKALTTEESAAGD